MRCTSLLASGLLFIAPLPSAKAGDPTNKVPQELSEKGQVIINDVKGSSPYKDGSVLKAPGTQLVPGVKPVTDFPKKQDGSLDFLAAFKETSGAKGLMLGTDMTTAALGAATNVGQKVQTWGPDSVVSPEVKTQASAYGQFIEDHVSNLSGPAVTDASVQAGDSFQVAGRHQDAVRNYQRALTAQPDNLTARQGLAQSLYMQGRTEEARVEAQKVLAADPDNQVAKLMAGPSEGVKSAQGVTEKFKKLTQSFLHGPSAEEPLTGAAKEAGSLPGASLPGAVSPQAAIPAPQQTPQQAPGLAAVPEPAHFAPLVLKALSKREMGDYTGAFLSLTQAVD
ncbi:MAG: tetratricopeptide repeat protein [Elusimicrobia bacterium]|nr:tetratricopeptide repeat protein [Elusimicrobiota bacterium]